MFRKFSISILLIIFFIFLTIGSLLVYYIITSKITNISEAAYSHTAKLERENDFLIELNLKNTSSPAELEELCYLKIEEGQDFIKVANGYKCIAEIYLKKGTSLSFLKAIHNLSLALDINPNQKTATLLAKTIFGENIPQNYSKKEKTILLEALKNADEDLKKRIYYRLSLIEKKENNFSQASKYKNKASDGIEPSNIINIAFTITENYAKYAATTIASSLLNSYPDSFYNFYIVTDKELSEAAKKQLTSMQHLGKYNVIFKVAAYDLLPQKRIAEMIKDNNIFNNKILFYRIILDKLFPDLDKILYLDVDLLVKQDLFNLYNKNIEDYYMAGILEGNNISLTEERKECNFESLSYINSGVLLMNLEEMRANDFFKNFMNVLANDKCKFALPDQDAINVSATNKIKLLSPRFNAMHGFDAVGGRDKQYNDLITHYAGRKLKPFSYEETWAKNPSSLAPTIQEWYRYNDLSKMRD